ncbi:MAG TPA: regulatory protein RecX [Methylovorus sp.]|jgi:regulatory protein|nr:regulatory protein RecX [Methylovorus sp.]
MTTAKSKALSALRERALALLARREHTALELKRKLMRKPRPHASKRFPRQNGEDFSDAVELAQDDTPAQPAIPDEELEEHIEQLLQDFRQRGWLSEERFTEQVVHARQQKFGSLRIAHELKQKGVNDALIAEAMQQVKQDELSHALQIYRKKFSQAPSSREEWAKQARFMQGRGFSMDMIKQVINAGKNVETTDSEDR